MKNILEWLVAGVICALLCLIIWNCTACSSLKLDTWVTREQHPGYFNPDCEGKFITQSEWDRCH